MTTTTLEDLLEKLPAGDEAAEDASPPKVKAKPSKADKVSDSDSDVVSVHMLVGGMVFMGQVREKGDVISVTRGSQEFLRTVSEGKSFLELSDDDQIELWGRVVYGSGDVAPKMPGSELLRSLIASGVPEAQAYKVAQELYPVEE